MYFVVKKYPHSKSDFKMDGSASQAGFYYQNNIAALKILDSLFFNTDITHIYLENYAKGKHIDDVIVHRKDRVEYIQVKWSEESSYTLYNLLTATKSKKSIFKQLAEGYEDVVSKSELEFSIILFTNKKESPAKRPSEGIHFSFTNVKKNIIEPLKSTSTRYDTLPNYNQYKEILERIREECGLDEDSFNHFLKSLEFRFNQDDIPQVQNAIKNKLDSIGMEEGLFDKLLNEVVKWSLSGENITKELVLEQLGVSNRFEDKLSHYFKTIDEKYYVQNSALLEKIEVALTELDGGYILIEGLPGIGKSTALTKFREQNSNVTLAYYCFIPDSKSNFGELRHKSDYFLKSLCVTIEKSFPHLDLPNKYSKLYEEKLTSYIEYLGGLNQKVIFIIDGLDHVYRDIEFQKDSLLNQIKGTLPQNVFFILSSQHKSVLSKSVHGEISLDERRYIVVPKFSQVEILKYLENKEIEASKYINEIEIKSQGIPLYLHYISEMLLKSDERDYKEILNDMPNLDNGEINSYHEYLFQDVGNDEFTRWVLAIMAYRKENSDIKTIVELLKFAKISKNEIDVSSIINKFSHILKQHDGRSYSIFHNSFREFIIRKTPELKDTFNKALSSFYGQNLELDEAYRNYFLHLSEAGEYQTITNLVNIDWIKKAWANFRTISEIKNNLNLALNACIELKSLSEFIRIGFLRAQIQIIGFNIESSGIDLSVLYLNAGFTQNSIRSIWDGDFVLTNKTYFSYYLCEYYSKTGELLPPNIIKQGLSQIDVERDLDNLVTNLEAEALITKDIVRLFEYIDTFEWHESKEHRRDYLKKKYSEEENAKNNLKVKTKIVDHLYSLKKGSELFLLSEHINDSSSLSIKIKISLIKLLLPSEKASAVSLLNKIDMGLLPDKPYFKLIGYCSDFLNNVEILQLFGKREIHQPILYLELIDKENHIRNIRGDIIDLYESLKPIWILKPSLIDTTILNISTLPFPARNIYNSIMYLSELWNKKRTSDIQNSEMIVSLKKSLNELYVTKRESFRKTNQGLLDYSNDDYHIATNLEHFFDSIFSFAVGNLNKEGLEILIDCWLELEAGKDGYRYFSIALKVAKNINKVSDTSDLKLKIINHAETIARREEDTNTLLEYLGEIADMYGKCGFQDDFRRIYEQLFDIAFGVAHRKDYQASYIIDAIELLHKKAPQGTLKRLADSFEIQNQLIHAGNSRMHHICLSRLIEITGKYYPQLAFKLIEENEKHISRAESLDIVLESLIEVANKDDLFLLFSVLKTFPKWGVSGTHENYFLHISLKLLDKAISLKHDEFIPFLLKDVQYHAVVELESEKELKVFFEMLQSNRYEPSEYMFSIPEEEDTEIVESSNQNLVGRKRQSISDSFIDIQESIKLFEDDFSQFKKLIKGEIKQDIESNLDEAIHQEYNSVKSDFLQFHEGTQGSFKTSSHLIQVVKYYREFGERIIESCDEEIITFEEFSSLVQELITKIDKLFLNNIFEQFVNQDFNLKNWKRSFLKHLKRAYKNVQSMAVSIDLGIQLVENVSILSSDRLIDFITKWFTGQNQAILLLKIANRINNFSPEKSKEILLSIADNQYDNLWFSKGGNADLLEFDPLELYLNMDRSFGKKFILKTYLHEKSRYESFYGFIGDLTSLIKYEQYFNEDNVEEAYYEANFSYNEELAKGLPMKQPIYQHISLHKETDSLSLVISRYLINLFNYPVVKVRQLALKSVFDLIQWDKSFLKTTFGVAKKANSNIMEHYLTVLNAIAIVNPNTLFPLKKELFDIVDKTHKNHFNINEQVIDCLILLKRSKSTFLNINEVKQLMNLNAPSVIIYDKLNMVLGKGKHFLYSEYQLLLLESLYKNDDDETAFQDDLYSDLIRKNLGNYTFQEEGEVHKLYNINSNFDTIEINSLYHDEVQDSLNKLFNNKIKRSCFEESYVKNIRREFKLYDPSTLLYEVKQRPKNLNWLSNDISEEDYIAYKDIQDLKKSFLEREEDYIILFESGSQRARESYSENQFACYFEAFAYVKKRGEYVESIKNDKIYPPILKRDKFYTFELPSMAESTSFPIEGIKPLLEMSTNHFRNEDGITIAHLLNDIFDDLGIERFNLLEILQGQTNSPIKAIHWQDAFTSSGRRRFKPISEGFTLMIKKDVLKKYLIKEDLILSYEFDFSRSTTKYRHESQMDWFDFKDSLDVIFY